MKKGFSLIEIILAFAIIIILLSTSIYLYSKTKKSELVDHEVKNFSILTVEFFHNKRNILLI